jgi:CheY-like chemotaxis protein
VSGPASPPGQAAAVRPDGGVLLVSGDLLFGSRVRAAAESLGMSCRMAPAGVSALTQLAEARWQVVLVDLETPGLSLPQLLQRAAAACRAGVIAYAPHVRHGVLESARQAGCPVVLTRGQFDAQLPELLAGALSAAGTTAAHVASGHDGDADTPGVR